MKKFKYLGLAILLILISCNKSNKLVDITSKIEKDAGFVDLVLSITEKKETDSAFVYTAKGLYNTEEVGIQISPSWREHEHYER
jgi:predicted CopG family antitoxin